jgi:hypothetical protein
MILSEKMKRQGAGNKVRKKSSAETKVDKKQTLTGPLLSLLLSQECF